MARKFKTPFTDEFKAKFIAGNKWPTSGDGRIKVAKELNDVSAALFVAAIKGKRPAKPASARTLKNQVLAFLFAKKWPVNADLAGVARSLKREVRTLRMTEALVITGQMMQAASDHRFPGEGTGTGQSSKIPPH